MNISNSSKNPLFSVIIPLYNKEYSIVGTISSVLSQNFSDYEVVIVDDGSKDTSLERVSRVNSDRIKIVTQKNSGVSVARNRGIDEATGRYMAFLDADDIWTPDHLQDLKTLIDLYPDSSLYSSAHVVIRDGVKYEKEQPTGRHFVSDAGGFFEEYAKRFSLVNSSTACMRKETLKNIGGFPVGVTKGEDVIVWIKASLIGGIAYSSNVCAFVNEDAENRSDQMKNGEIPFFILWLDGELRAGHIDIAFAEKARNFLHRAVLFNAAGCSLRGETRTVKLYRKLFAARSLALSIALTVLLFVPTGLLRVLRKSRHKAIGKLTT